MIRAEKLDRLREWEAHLRDLESAWDKLHSLTGASTDGPLGDATWCVFDAYTQAIAREIGEAIDSAIEMIERLEAAEKDVALKERVIDALGSELAAVAKERDALRAKIAEMERQEPTAWVRGRDNHRHRKLSFEKPAKSSPDKFHWSPLYALPGAKGEAK